MSITIKTSGNPIRIAYSLAAANNTNLTTYQLYLNGAPVGNLKYSYSTFGLANPHTTIADNFIVAAASGVHKIDLYWSSPSGTTVQSTSIYRNINAMEIS
jgi:hypothetical protein